METGPTEQDKKIFEAIANLMTQDEFLKANSEFLHNKCGIFEDTEENKLEYTIVYNDYVQIMEQAIEGELKTSY